MAQLGQRQVGVGHPQPGGCRQRGGQGIQRAGGFQPADRHLHLHRSLHALAKVGGFAVGKAVGLVAHIVDHPLFHHPHRGVAGAHKGQQVFNMVACLDVDGVGPFAQRAVGVEIMLGQMASSCWDSWYRVDKNSML